MRRRKKSRQQIVGKNKLRRILRATDAYAVEWLEQRLLLSAGIPPAIVVGRTLSSYFVGGIQNNQEAITYTVYNEQAEAETGVLLTDTLEPGITIASASQQPNQNGQKLAWSLGTIQGFDRASITLTVNLPATIPSQLDTGAVAFATVDGGPVSNTTPAATLRPGTVDPTLLDATPDTDATDLSDTQSGPINDPYIQEEAAKLDYNAQNIFNFLQDDITYNSYLGSVRGARGTLWSDAGNALDVASLGVALIRASGIPAQYVSGTLSQSQAQQLILSMFPASYQTVGNIPAGTQLSDPADDPQLLAETESHYWFQFDTGSGMTDADPLMPGATVGQAFTASTGTFTEVPDNLRETTEVSLIAEIYSDADAAFGVDPFTDTEVLDLAFNDVNLVGRPVTVGNFVSGGSAGAAGLSAVTNTYTPYLELSDEANPNPTQDEVIQGTPYQEILTNFPLGSQILTGLFLNITLAGPDGAAQSYSRTLVDRIGYAARQGLVQPDISIQPNQPPILSNTDVFTVNVLPGVQSAAPLNPLRQVEQQYLEEVSGFGLTASSAPTAVQLDALRDLYLLYAEAQSAGFLVDSGQAAATIASAMDVIAYYDRPRITIFSEQLNPATENIDFAIDLRCETMRVIAFPGQNSTAEMAFNLDMGLFDNALEDSFVPQGAGSTDISTVNIFTQASVEGIPLVFLSPQNLSSVSSLGISAAAKAYITTAINQGLFVLVPSSEVKVGATSAVSWFQINPTTGQVTGVLESGIHSATIAENVATENVYIEEIGWVEPEVADFVAALEEEEFATAVYVEEAAEVGTLGEELGVVAEQSEGIEFWSKVTELIDLFPLGHAVKLALIAGGASAETAEAAALSLDTAIKVAPYVAATYTYYLGQILASVDPPLPDQLVGTQFPNFVYNAVSSQVKTAASLSSAAVAGSANTSNTAVSGVTSASWADSSTSEFNVDSVQIADASVSGPGGTPIGTGALSLDSATLVQAAVSGDNSYSVAGSGTLSFYGPAESSLAVSGDWTSFTASVTGGISITLTVPDGALVLNGVALSAGTYTITTTSAALSGSGATTSPNFSGSASITATGSTVNLAPGTGAMTVGGSPLNISSGATLDGYSGTVAVSANGDGTDSVSLNGNAANVLTVSATPNPLTTDQNTPVTLATNVNTSLADRYNLTANAPAGWTVSIDSNGNVTATPATGLQSGTYPIQVIAQSTTDPDLIAQTTVNITVTPTPPGISLAVQPDAVFSVPSGDAELPTAFRASIQNLGPSSDSYNLTFSNVPTGFTLADSGTNATVPAGETGVLGVYLQLNSGQTIPPPGTVLSFNVTATSTSNPAITQTQVVTFTIPAIQAVSISASPTTVNAIAGISTPETITLTNAGNVPETVTPSSTSSPDLSVSGLAPVTLAVGQSASETLSFTADPATPEGTDLEATITTNYGSSAVTVQAEVVEVTEVTASPTFTVPGGQVDVQAQIFDVVNPSEQAEVSYTVTDAKGDVLFTSSPVTASFDVSSTHSTVDLGNLDTTGFAPGEDTITVSVADSSGTPIPGATDTGVLFIGTPVSATISTTPQIPAAGGAVGVTLQLTNETPLAPPFSVVGQSSIAGAVGVGLDGALSYVGASGGIDVVDVSDPTQPQVLSIFGSSDLAGAKVAQLQVYNNELVVLVSAPGGSTSPNGPPCNLLIYSLANPTSPVLLGRTPLTFDGGSPLKIGGFTISNNHVYTTTAWYRYFIASGVIVGQFGESLDVDITNPASPTVVNAIYNDPPNPATIYADGTSGYADGTSPFDQIVAVNTDTLWIGSTTATGADTNGSDVAGQILVVDTTDPSSPSVLEKLNIPGMAVVTGISIQGNQALVIGSSENWLPGIAGYGGDVVVATLDLTNPDDPTLVSTQNLGIASTGIGALVSVGNGQYITTRGENTGNQGNSPQLLLLNAIDPQNVVATQFAVPSFVNGYIDSGGLFYTSDGSNLTIYQFGPSTIPVTAKLTVPTNNGVSIVPGTFNVAPTSTTVNPDGSETLEWDLGFSNALANQTITFSEFVTGLTANEALPVVDGGTVSYVSDETPGQIALPPQFVTATQVSQSLSIPVQIAFVGSQAIANDAVSAEQLGDSTLANQLTDLSLALNNLGFPVSPVALSQAEASVSAIVSLLGADPYTSSFATELTADGAALEANSTSQVALSSVEANLGDDVDNIISTLQDEVAHGFTISLLSSNQVGRPQVPVTFQIELQNTGSATTTYNLSISGLPSGVTSSFSQNSITLAPGQVTPGSGVPDVTVTLTSTSATEISPYSFQIIATAVGATEITQSVTGSVTPRSQLVQVTSVTPSPTFTNPGGQVDVQAKILDAVNVQQQALVSFTVTDSNGVVLFTSLPVFAELNVLTTLTTVDLGNLDTTGFALGEDTITVSVTDLLGNPIPGATGTGKLLIGTPVSATLTTSPQSLPAGDGTVNTTLQVNYQGLPGAPSFSLVGTTPITGASGVAFDGTLAYVGVSGGIDVVDISNPASPTVLSTFAASDFSGMSIVQLQVYNNKLVVLAQETASPNNSQLLLIYSLAQPSSPSLLSKTPLTINGQNDALLAGFTISNNLLYTNAYWYRYLIDGGEVIAQFGESIVIDISTPAAPVIDSVIYNDPPSPSTIYLDGTSGYPDGTSNIWQVAPVNSSDQWIGTTTATGTTTTGVQGEILVTDTGSSAGPTDPLLLNTIDVPGMAVVTGISIEGNQAFVIGSTGYWGTGTTGLTGYVVVAVYNITNFVDPTLVSEQTLNVASDGISFVRYLGNDLYITDSVAGPGNAPQMLVFNAANPSDVTATEFTVPNNVPTTDFFAYDGYLFTVDGSNLSLYNLASTLVTPVIAQVTIPTNNGVSIVPGSFNIAPSNTVIDADSETLEWDFDFGATSTNQTITFQESVTGLAADESLPVVQDGTVQFATTPQPPGTVLNSTPAVATDTLTLPGQSVTGDQIIAMSPESQDVANAGDSATYVVTVANPTSSTVTYVPDVQGLSPDWGVQLPASVTVAPDSTQNYNLVLTSPLYASIGDYGFIANVIGNNGASSFVQGDFVIDAPTPAPDQDSHGIVVTLTPTQSTAGQGTSAIYTVQLTNTGSADDTFLLTSALPPGVDGTFSQPVVDVPPGTTNFRDVTLTLTPQIGTAVANNNFTVTATSTSNSSVSSSATAAINVVASGVSVSLNPPSGAPGSGFELTVTNTGNATDTFELALAGPASVVSTLGVNQVTLAAGASQTVSISTGAVSFATSGLLELDATATSENNPAVEAQATAGLIIPSSSGMTAGFSPGSQTLPNPGAATFVLQVNNIGNTQDSYQATIIGTSGPITGNIVGLDGQPTQSIPIFILPGLSAGDIVLQANLAGAGEGTVTVEIQSLSDGDIISIQTATLNVTAASQPPIANNDSYSTNEDSTLTVAPAGVLTNDTDPNNLALTASVVSGPSHGVLTFDANGDGGFKYVPNTGYAGADSFVYKATDTNGLSANATVNLTVTAVAPTATNDSYSTNEDTTLTVSAGQGVLANDSAPAGESLTASVVSGPNHGVLTLDANGDGGFKYVPNAGFAGKDSFTYKATDTNGLSANATVNLTVTAVAPTATNDSYSTNENTTITLVAPGVLSNDTAPAGETLTASVVTGPTYGVLTLDANGDGGFKYVPNANFTGMDSFTYKATDTNGLSVNATVNLTVTPTVITPPTGPVVQIDAGGGAAGPYVADTDYSGGNTTDCNVVVDTSQITAQGLAPAPQSVYETERYGNFTYTIPNLTPGGSYTVRLDFAEIYWNAAGQRVFNVAINGSQVLSNFDIFVAAGGADKAIARVFTATADSGGKITIAFTSIVNYAKVSDITITPVEAPVNQAPAIATNPTSKTVTVGQSVTFTASASGNPAPTVQWQVSTDGGKTFSNITGATSVIYSFATSAGENGDEYQAVFSNGVGAEATTTAATLTVNAAAATPVVQINAGGAASGSYSADTDFSGGTTANFNVPVDTSQITAQGLTPAPQSVYDTERYGNFTYTIPNLTPGGSYNVRLDFAEIYWNAAGQRVFDVSINGSQVLSNFDIFVAAGGADKAIARTFIATANASGKITITFTSIVNNAKVSDITVTPTGAAPVNQAPVVTTNPTSQTVTVGQSVSFTAAASGNPTPTVQWQVSTDGGKTFNNITGATSVTYSFTTSAGENGDEYQAVFSNGVGAPATTTAATLTLNAAATTPVVQINAGGAASGSYSADTDYSGGSTTNFGNVAVDTSQITAQGLTPAPQSVYDTERYGNFTYTIPNLIAGQSYNIRLDFAELYFSAAGQRVFDVAINGSQVLSNFDIFVAAGGAGKAIAKVFTATADASGKITIVFTSLVNNAKVSDITITPA